MNTDTCLNRFRMPLQIAVLTLLLMGTNKALAGAEDCKSQFFAPLPHGEQMKFCTLPDNRFPVGRGLEDEKPIHFREFSPFQVGQFEVTQSQFTAVMGTAPWLEYRGPHGEPAETAMSIGPNFPAVWVSYEEAARFAKLLSLLDGKATYRLLSEAEFEYAASGNIWTRFPWGDNLNPDFLFYGGNNFSKKNYAHTVDSCPNANIQMVRPGYCANPFGLYHMLGNVFEWTADVYFPSYYIPHTKKQVRTDGHDYLSPYGEDQLITFRGGSVSSESTDWKMDPRTRYKTNQWERAYDIGFRVARFPIK